jgi:hypothetical protein
MTRIQTIIAATDGSEPAHRAVAHAAQLASETGAAPTINRPSDRLSQPNAGSGEDSSSRRPATWAGLLGPPDRAGTWPGVMGGLDSSTVWPGLLGGADRFPPEPEPERRLGPTR